MNLSNDIITIEVAEHGAELVSLKKGEREYMWNGDELFWNRHAPILFPAVGKPYNNELHIDGKLYVYGMTGSDGSLDFRATKSGITVVFDSVISGSGWLSFQPRAAGYKNTYCFAGDNTFNGGIFVYQGYSNTLMTIKFAKESSWGTDGTSLKDSLVLQ